MWVALSSRFNPSTHGSTVHLATMLSITAEQRRIAESWFVMCTRLKTLISLWYTSKISMSFKCSRAMYSSALAVRFTLLKLRSVSEDPDPPIIATHGSCFHNGLHAGKPTCDHLTNSGKPLAG